MIDSWKLGRTGIWMVYTESKELWKKLKGDKQIKHVADYFNKKGKLFAVQFQMDNEAYEQLHGNQGTLF